jgi:hypothetical protein
MKYLFWTGAVLTLLTLAPAGLYWLVYVGTKEALARQRAVAFFRFAVVIVLATFNIWIFGRVVLAIKDIWFPAPPAPAVVVPAADETPAKD